MKTRICPEEFATFAGVSRETGINAQTIRDAIARGEIDVATLSDETTIINVDSARRWASDRPKRGRKPKTAE